MSRSPVAPWLLLALSALLGACNNYGDALERGQRYYEDNQYEQALAVFRQLEGDEDSLDAVERVRYCYLRGMTDYRLGYRADARYWLGLSRAASRHASSALEEEELQRLEATLTELNATVFGVAAPSQPAAPQVLGKQCEWSSECESGFICESGACVQAQ
jgi:hypothetical protein